EAWLDIAVPKGESAERSGRAADLAEIGAVRGGAADRIDRRCPDQQVEIGAVRAERVVAGRAELGAGLPPAMLADHDARVEVVVEPGAGAHAALRGLDRHPLAGGNAARLRRCGMQLDF